MQKRVRATRITKHRANNKTNKNNKKEGVSYKRTQKMKNQGSTGKKTHFGKTHKAREEVCIRCEEGKGYT
jgi:regulator of replication initiation timing